MVGVMLPTPSASCHGGGGVGPVRPVPSPSSPLDIVVLHRSGEVQYPGNPEYSRRDQARVEVSTEDEIIRDRDNKDIHT